MSLKSLAMTCVMAYLGLMAVPAFAQSDRGTIVGEVVDPDGRPIPGVTVVAENPETGVKFNTVTTATGNYTLPGLPAGVYNVVIELTGFSPFRQDGVRIFVGQTARVDGKLSLGGITEETTVTADASMLNTQSGDLSTSVTTENLNQLPLNFGARGNFFAANIRNPYSFVTLVPGGQISSYSSLKLNGAPTNTFQIRIEGMESNNHRLLIRIDQVQPSVESLEEMTVHTSNFAAEYGSVAGGVFNLTAKSGTNRLTGSMFEYYVHEKLFYAGLPYTDDGSGKLVVPRNRRNNFGGSIGGPVVLPGYDGRNRTFFFFTLEQFNQIETKSGLLETMPTDLMRQGNFSEALTGRQLAVDPLGRPIMEGTIYDPRTQRLAPNGQIIRDPFPNNTIPMDLFDPVALKVQEYIPRATRAGVLNNWDQSFPADTIKTIATIKADHNFASIGGKASFYYSQYWGPHYNGSDGLPIPITAVRRFETQTDTVRASYDWTMTPTTLATFKVGWLRHWNPDRGLPEVRNFDVLGTLGLVGTYTGTGFPDLNAMETSTGGGLGLAPVTTGSIPNTKKPSFLVNISHARNTHTYKTGFEWRNDIFGSPSLGQSQGSYNFSGEQTSLPSTQGQNLQGGTVGHPYASFLMGRVNSSTISNITDPEWIKPAASAFIQDTWRTNSKLTLDYGVRWDYQGFPREREYRRGMFSANVLNPTAGNLPGAMAYEGYSGPNVCNCDFVETYKWSFGPRLGISYQLDQKTVLRGGWGLTYTQTADGQANGGGTLGAGGWKSFSFSTPAFGEPSSRFQDGIVYDKAALDAVDNLPGIRPSSPSQTDAPTAPIHPDAGRMPKMWQWNASVQREITSDLLVDIAYVGNRGSGFSYSGYQEYILNNLTPERLAQFGLDPANSAADRTLLRSRLDSATAISRGFGTAPYPGYSLANTVAQRLRPFPQFNSNLAYSFSPGGETKYDSLQIKATQRYSRGLNLTATFTWQNERNNQGVDNPNGDLSEAWVIPSNSEPFITALAFSYQLPGFGIGNRALRAIVQDWTVSGLFRYASGEPINVPSATTNLNQLFFNGNSRMNRVEGESFYADGLSSLNDKFDPERDFVLNPDAWVNPPDGQYSTSLARYTDYRQMHRPEEQLTFGRVFRLGGRRTFSVRAEIFNVFNRLNNVINNPSSGNPRQTQTRNAEGKTTNGFGFINRGSQFGPPRSGQLVFRFGW